jgi:FkbM family methyltransferase
LNSGQVESAIVTDYLSDLIRPNRLTAVVDIGASPFELSPPYKSLLEKRLCRVFGFEPQPEPLAVLNSRKSDLEEYLPYAVGDGQSRTLQVCRVAGMTSLFSPDPQMLRLFPGFSEWGEVVQQIAVTTRRLDDIAEIAEFDFLKIDAQGAELMIFQSGRERLKNVVAIQTEVSFVPLYKDQPTFGEIDVELRRSGFLPHSFPEVNKRLIAPLIGPNPYLALNQILEADVVYVRDFSKPERLSPEQLKHLAMVAHHCYGSFDLTANCLHHLSVIGAVSADTVQRYITSLQSLSRPA